MGIFSKSNNAKEQQNIGKMTSDKAVEIIKTLSGGEVKYTKKIVDNIVVMTGASGGTGVSTLVSNIAYVASKHNLRVLVIDLNIMYPTQHIYFADQKNQDLVKPDLVGYLIGKNTLGECIENHNNISVMYAHNRSLMDSINCESDVAIANFNEAIHKLRQLYDLILIDCPLKIEHTLCNTAFYISDSIYMVWDEGISSIANTERVRRNMAISGIDAYTKMKVILNKRTNVQYNDYPFKKLNTELVQIIPFEPDVIYSTLRSEVFCEKGSSKSKNADLFQAALINLTNSIMQNGGYVE